MFVNSIPIYWGSPLVHLDFNPRSFINHHDYNNDENVIDRIIELDQDKYKMADLLKESWFSNNQLNEFCDRERLRIFFEKAFTEDITPVSSTIMGKYFIHKQRTKIVLSRFKKKF